MSEGEAQRYHDHAVTLKNTLKFLRRNEKCPIKDSDGGIDLLRCERLDSLEVATRERVISVSYVGKVSDSQSKLCPLDLYGTDLK